MRYGLFDARVYDPPVERRYNRIWAMNFNSRLTESPTTTAPVTAKSLRLLRLLSVTDLLEDPASPPPNLPGVRVAYRGSDATVYAYQEALPRIFVVNRQQVVAGADRAMAAVTAPHFEGQQLAVTEHAIPGVAQNTPSHPQPPGQARLISYRAERLVAQATASGPSLLVLTDNYFPGWKVSVDGRPTPTYRVDYLLRGVPLPAGSHRVVFSYQAASWRAGWIISALTLLALLATALAGLRQRRPRAGKPGPRLRVHL